MPDSVTVIGGVYHETCILPWRETVLGSGGRAACVLASLGCSVHLLSVADQQARNTFLPIADSFLRIDCSFDDLDRSAGFFYSHPLAEPMVRRPSQASRSIISRKPSVSSLLCFGMLEGVTSIDAETVVYDPQDPDQPSWFRESSTAKRLAYVLNEGEAKQLSGEPTAISAAAFIADKERAEVVVVKRGPFGALVWTRGQIDEVPCYQTPAVYKIGSGDVFSAVFFYEWGVKCQTPVEAVRAAVRATAIYCAKGGEPQVIRPGSYIPEKVTWPVSPKNSSTGRSIYLAGPFFTTPQRWMVSEAYRVLNNFGLRVFSPFHHIGLGPAEKVVTKDLAGIDSSSLVYAILDGLDSGTIFEIGYARAKGISVIVLAENLTGESLTMPTGSGCKIFSDFAASLYACCWA